MLSAPDEAQPPARVAVVSLEQAIERFAPVLFQETRDPRLDLPIALDADGSGRLEDDYLASTARGPAVFYVSGREDRESFFLFYAVYYAADYSMRGSARDIDHLGDLEGALVIVDRARGGVDAVITEAHGRFYLFEARQAARTLSGGASGSLALREDGRPVLFSEAGGHGIYAFGLGRWTPRGGNRYPTGTAIAEWEQLRYLSPPGNHGIRSCVRYHIGPSVELRPLSEIDRFVLPSGWLRGLPRAAR